MSSLEAMRRAWLVALFLVVGLWFCGVESLILARAGGELAIVSLAEWELAVVELVAEWEFAREELAEEELAKEELAEEELTESGLTAEELVEERCGVVVCCGVIVFGVVFGFRFGVGARGVVSDEKLNWICSRAFFSARLVSFR